MINSAKNMQRPLPEDLNTQAYGMGDVIFILHRDLGIPIHNLLGMSPQDLYDIAVTTSSENDVEATRSFVVIDDATGDALKEHFRSTLGANRPDHADVADNIGITSRSTALEQLPGLDVNTPLLEIEKELYAKGGQQLIVLEDDASAEYGREMNRIISLRPHGRCKSLDGEADANKEKAPNPAGGHPEVLDYEDLSPDLQLQLLTASDPKVRRNMMRYSAALRIALTGQQHDSPDLKILIGMGFGMSDETDVEYQRLTLEDGNDRIYLRFNVDDALGPPDGMGVIRREGEKAVLYGQCRLWAPPTAKSPVIIFEHEDRYGCFIFRRGKALIRVDELPEHNLMPGFKRASHRLARLVKSKRLKHVAEPFMRVTIGSV